MERRGLPKIQLVASVALAIGARATEAALRGSGLVPLGPAADADHVSSRQDAQQRRPALIAAVAGCMVALAAAALVCIQRTGKRSRTQQLRIAEALPRLTASQEVAWTPPKPHAVSPRSSLRSLGPGLQPERLSGSIPAHVQLPQLEPPPRPDATAPLASLGTLARRPTLSRSEEGQCAHLGATLRAMATAAPPQPFAGRFRLLADAQHVHGAQALVAFAREPAPSYAQCAIKLFVSRNAFDTETSLYRHAALRAVLPTAIAASANADGAVRLSDGAPAPPFLVTARGVTLRQWVAGDRGYGDLVDLLESLVELLAALHAAGYVHRDLKQDNILLLLDSQVWRLLDCGIMAAAGALLPPAPVVLGHASQRSPIRGVEVCLTCRQLEPAALR